MCLATPVKITKKINKLKLQVEDDRIIDISLIPDAKVGDWVLCHADLAVNIIDAGEAQKILKLSRKIHQSKEKNG